MEQNIVYIGTQKDGFKFGMRLPETEFRNLVYDAAHRDHRVVYERITPVELLDDTYGEFWAEGKNWRGAKMNVHELARVLDHKKCKSPFLYRADYMFGFDPPVYTDNLISEWEAVVYAAKWDCVWCDVLLESEMFREMTNVPDMERLVSFYAWYFRDNNIKPWNPSVYLEFCGASK